MIKKIILPAIICTCSSILNAQQTNLVGRFVLTGRIIEKDTKFLCLSYQDLHGKQIKDTCYLKNESFTFTGYLNGATYSTLAGHTKSNSSDDPDFTAIFLEPCNIKAIIVENNFKNSKITGSHTQDEFTMLEENKKVNRKIENELGIELKDADNSDTSLALKNKRTLILDKYLKYRKLDQQTDYIFIKTHPDSYLSPYLMTYYFGSRKLPLDSAEMFFRSFNVLVQKSLYGRFINDQIIARKLSATGSPAPLFSNTDINGQEINLQSFKGKSYVVLDFWASWCVPCRAISPHLKELYKKYHPKGLDVISISWDFDKKHWADAVAKDSMNSWHNVFGNISQPGDGGLIDKYAIASLPTLILIDKNGTIIGRFRGDGEDGDETILYDKLNKIFAVK